MNVLALLIDREDSQAALDWAVDYTRTVGATLHVVTAAHDTPAAPGYVSPLYLDELQGQLDSTGVPVVLHEPAQDPARQVLELIDTLPAELAVVGLRKRSVTAKLVLGSHAQDVMLHAGCPVVTVRNQPEAA